MFNQNESSAQAKKEQHEVMTFHYSNNSTEVQTVYVNNEPWLVAADVCAILGVQNVPQALNGLDEDEKLVYTLHRSGQQREVNCVNESGLYNLIFKSRKPEAKIFRKWVTSEVLPAIRKKGYYGVRNEAKCDYVDLRDVPYSRQALNESDITVVELEGENWFSINDVHRAIGSRTGSVQTVKRLNVKQTLAKKLLLYGNTQPAWFTNTLGVQLILSGSQVLKSNRQLALNF